MHYNIQLPKQYKTKFILFYMHFFLQNKQNQLLLAAACLKDYNFFFDASWPLVK